jgi:Carboxypeptidase regulatory-like domain
MIGCRRLRAVAAAWAAVAIAVSSAAAALAAGAEVDVRVVDAQTKKPVHLARIVLSGDGSVVGYTDSDGVASFTGLPEGTYTARVSRRGYVATSSRSFDVESRLRNTLDVSLAPAGALQVIGHVEARSSVRVSTTEITDRGPLERLAGGSLAQALQMSGEATVDGGLVSIDGHDPAQTGVSIDGVPVGGIGQPADLQGLNADLFSGVSVSSSSDAALGGNLNLLSLEPTLAVQTSTTLSYSTANRALWRSWLRGTAGNVGYVYSHASAGADGPLQGLVFRDASGLTYPHREGSSTRGDLLKLRVPLSAKSSFTLTGLSSESSSDDACDRISGPLVCGEGPGNGRTANTALAIARYRYDSGAFGMSFAGVSESSRYDVDRLSRYVNGVASPAAVSGMTRLTSGYFSANLVGAASNTILNVSATQVAFDQAIAGPFSPAGGGRSSLIDASLRHERHLSDAVDAYATLLYERNFVDKPLGIGVGASWKPGKGDLVSFSQRLQNGGAIPVLSGSLTDPASLVYDCAAHAVFGTTVGDAPGPSSVSDTRLSYAHRSAAGSFSAEFGRQTQHGTSVETLLNGSDANLGAGFLQAVSAFYATPAACGTSFPLAPSDVYLARSIAGVDRIYQTARLGFARQIGDALAIGGYVRHVDARIATSDPRFLLPASVTIPGHQLPNVAPWRAGLIADLKPSRSAFELMALAQFVSSNNERNLPAYTTLSFGATYASRRGDLTLALTNATNQYAKALTSPQFAVPLPAAGGGTVVPLALPLPPRALSLTYSVRTGGVARRTVDAGAADQQAVDPSVAFRALPEAPPADPFAIDRGESNCTPERVGDITKVMESLRRAVSVIEAYKAKNGSYPQELDLSRAGTADVSLVYHATGAGYAISLAFHTPGVLTIPCVDIAAAGDVAAAQKAGLYTDTTLPRRALEFVFMPRYGLYVVFHQGVLTAATPAPVAVEKPTEPLQIRGSCPSGDRPLIEEVVRAVRAEGAAGAPAAVTLENGAVVTRRSADVIAVQFPDVLSRAIFEGCTFTTSLSAERYETVTGARPEPRTLHFVRAMGFVVPNG